MDGAPLPQVRDLGAGGLIPSFVRGQTTRSFFAEGLAWIYDLDDALFREINLARMPGAAPDDALPLLREDRRIRSGPYEALEVTRTRLRLWIDTWQLSGTPLGQLLAAQAYLAPAYPKVRIITRGNIFYTLADGAVGRMLGLAGHDPLPEGIGGRSQPYEHLRAAGLFDRHRHGSSIWDWDSQSHPQNADRWWHYWMVVYPPSGDALGSLTFNGTFDSGLTYDTPTYAWGLDYPWGNLLTLRQVIREHAPVDKRCVAVIITEDPNDFDHDSPGAGDPVFGWPNGHWGRNAVPDGTGGAISARRHDLRFIDSKPNE